MYITKLGHCCLLVEENGLRILTDPGCLTDAQNNARNIDLIFITHEHSDHFDLPSLREVLRNNPAAEIITNRSVQSHIQNENMPHSLLEDGDATTKKGVRIEAFGAQHAVIHPDVPGVINTGYIIANKLFYPGDAFTAPKRTVEILALPVAGTWMKISEAIEYAKKIKPKTCFPVHDGMLKLDDPPHHRVPAMLLPRHGISFVVLEMNRRVII